MNDSLKNNRNQRVPLVAEEWISPEYDHLHSAPLATQTVSALKKIESKSREFAYDILYTSAQYLLSTWKGNGLYYFCSPPYGSCKMEAKTSGKHGFGMPKYFVVTSCDPSVHGSFALWYRDTSIEGVRRPTRVRNVELVRIAISQFCDSEELLQNDTKVELNLAGLPFKGDVVNRHGRVLSVNSFMPKRRKDGLDIYA